MKSLFWPHKYRKFANWFIAAGIMLFYFYYKGYRPDFLDLKTFAFASTFLEKKFLVFIQNNMLDEIAFVTFHFGLYLQIFTDEKTAKEKHLDYRIASIQFAVKYTFLFILISYTLVFGYLTLLMLSFSFSISCILYIFRFHYLSNQKIKQ